MCMDIPVSNVSRFRFNSLPLRLPGAQSEMTALYARVCVCACAYVLHNLAWTRLRSARTMVEGGVARVD